jgi:hypothetical protein
MKDVVNINVSTEPLNRDDDKEIYFFLPSTMGELALLADKISLIITSKVEKGDPEPPPITLSIIGPDLHADALRKMIRDQTQVQLKAKLGVDSYREIPLDLEFEKPEA